MLTPSIYPLESVKTLIAYAMRGILAQLIRRLDAHR